MTILEQLDRVATTFKVLEDSFEPKLSADEQLVLFKQCAAVLETRISHEFMLKSLGALWTSTVNGAKK